MNYYSISVKHLYKNLMTKHLKDKNKTAASVDSERSNNIIFVGPLRHNDDTGGVVELFEDLLKTVGSSHNIFDTNARNYLSPLLMVVRFAWYCLVASMKKQEIALHGTARDYKYLGLIVLVCHKVFGLNYHTRKFAGNFDVLYEQMTAPWRWMIRQLLINSRMNYFETH